MLEDQRAFLQKHGDLFKNTWLTLRGPEHRCETTTSSLPEQTNTPKDHLSEELQENPQPDSPLLTDDPQETGFLLRTICDEFNSSYLKQQLGTAAGLQKENPPTPATHFLVGPSPGP